VVVGGAGAEVTGSGTGPDPYVVAVTSSTITGALTVTDTPSVDLELGGSGTLSDPYDLTAQVTLSMEDLSDAPDGSPDPGDVWIWDGTQWVFGPPSAGGGGAVVATGDGIAGDGSVTSPVVLDLTTGDGLAGAGTSASPLTVDAATWPYEGHTDDSVQDEGVPVYFSSTGALLAPRGVYLWCIDDPAEANPDLNNLGPNSDTIYRNPGTLALGAHDDPTNRYLVLARQYQDDAAVHGESELYQTFTSGGVSAFGVKVVGTSDRSNDQDPLAMSAFFYVRRDGQLYTSADVPVEGTPTQRFLPFAMQRGSTQVTGGANVERTKVVTFAVNRFTGTPTAMLTQVTGTENASDTNTEIWTSSVTSSSVTISVNRTNTTPVWVAYLAMQDQNTVLLQGTPQWTPEHERLRRHMLDLNDAGSGSTTATATCHTTDCPNEGYPIEVPSNYQDSDGTWHDNESFECGVCGQPITDVI
jgi:hypothetical protein